MFLKYFGQFNHTVCLSVCDRDRSGSCTCSSRTGSGRPAPCSRSPESARSATVSLLGSAHISATGIYI